LLVAAWDPHSIHRFDLETGAHRGIFIAGGITHPAGMAFGPDGNLYVTSFSGWTVQRFDAASGAPLGTFIPMGSGLRQPAALEFRPDGRLWVHNQYDNEVLRFDAHTGAFMDFFITSGAGGISAATDMAFGPDGDVYIAGRYTENVVRFDGQTGDPRWTVCETVSLPNCLTHGPDGKIYVGEYHAGTSLIDDGILRFADDGSQNGELPYFISGYIRPTAVRFGPDGNLYVATRYDVRAYHAQTGELLRTFWHPDLNEILAIAFAPGDVTPGDLDGDGDVDLNDLALLLSDFGCTSDCAGDIDNDGDTDLSDFAILLSNYGS
jgi:DNA-binding beta-propeller fold protein YncE